LIATHANKQVANKAEAGKLRYRYYVSKAAHYDAAPSGLRIPAREIEGLVTGRIAALFGDPLALIERAKLEVLPAHLPEVIQCGADPLVQVVRNRPTAWRCNIRGLENEILRSEAAAATWP
jgi:site-specific DNA recombinase